MADSLKYCTKMKFYIAALALQYSPLRPQNVCVDEFLVNFCKEPELKWEIPVSLILYGSDYILLNSLVVG